MNSQVWSCGGGVQSAAVAALIVQSRLPKPDLAVIVDTGHEKASTWAYCDDVLRPALAVVGVTLHRVQSEVFRTVGLFAHDEKSVLLPMFTTLSGRVSKLPAYCSNEWKQRVVMRWLRTQGVEHATNWLGISVDEMSRVRAGQKLWFQPRYPLIFDHPMRRDECISLVKAMGWPDAPRSSCYMCPNMRDAEWREMQRSHPDDFQRAVEVERKIRERDPHAFVHESCVALDQVDFTQYQGSLFGQGCAGGGCWT